jgi:hypothetical protein
MRCKFILPHSDQTKRGEEVEPIGIDYESRITSRP